MGPRTHHRSNSSVNTENAVAGSAATSTIEETERSSGTDALIGCPFPQWAFFILMVLVRGLDGGGCGWGVGGLLVCLAVAGNAAEPPDVDQVVTQETTSGGS